MSLLLRQWRHRRGLTLHQLAERSGINYVSISRVERARQNPTVGTLTKLARGLGISPRALLPAKAEEDGRGEE